MISVKVHMHGNLRRFLPDGVASVSLELPEGVRVQDVVEQLGAENEVGVAAIGKTMVPLSAQLDDGVSIDIFPHLEGG